MRARLVTWYRLRRADVLLASVVLLVTGPIVGLVWAQSATRYDFTGAVVDQHTVRLDSYASNLGVDRAIKDGHTYLDKAPGQPAMAIPLYAVYRIAGGEAAQVSRPVGNLGAWWQAFWCAAVPAALLAVAMRREAARISPRVATPVALAMAFGSMLLPFGTLLFGHVLTALLGFVAFRLLFDERHRTRDLVLAGVLAATAVAVEYTAGIVFLVLAVAAVVAYRRRSLWFGLGALGPVLATAVYQREVFGGALTFSYRYSAFTVHRTGIGGMGWPSLTRFAQVVFGERGFFTLTPLMLLGAVGLVLLARDRTATVDRVRVIVPLAVVIAFLVFHSGWQDATGGDSPGPRYLIPAIPFLTTGVAMAWIRFRRIAIVAAVISCTWMILATVTNPLTSETVPALQSWLRDVRLGDWTETLLTMRLGTWALALPFIAAAGVATRLFRVSS